MLAPVTSHLALVYRTLGEELPTQPSAAMPNASAFVLIYAGFSMLAALAVHRLLLRERGLADNADGAGVGRAISG